MLDRELEQILRRIGQRELSPSADLVRKTKQRIHRTRLLPVMIFLSLCLHLVAVAGGSLFLASPQIGWMTKIYAVLGVATLSTMLFLPVLSIREKLRDVFADLQDLTTYG